MVEVIRTEAATVSYDGQPVLDRLDWVVNSDERWVVLGPNGAGKTSLLNLLATTKFPTRGSVSLLGEELGLVDVFALRPMIGLVGDSRNVPASETVLNVVLTSAYAITGRWREEYDDVDIERAHELLSLMGVRHLSERRFVTLSDGEKKRTMIARALLPNPEVLLFDEPAAGLDLGAREGLLDRLSALAQNKLAPVQVMITHHVEEIPVGYTHALLLRDGQVVAQGHIDAVLTDENLTKTFDLPLSVRKVFARFWAFAV